MFFVRLWKWFIGLFQSKPEIIGESKIIPSEEFDSTSVPKMVLRHNNRRTTRGRHTQYAPIGNGIFKPIYHNG